MTAHAHVHRDVTHLVLIACLAAPAIALAQTDATRLRWVPDPRATTGSWVADPANHLAHATRARIDSIATALERETSAEIAVVVIDSLDGLEPGDAALLLHRRWAVGKRERDNGIVLLWSPARRQIFVSVGDGLEGVLPDARAGRIQDREMLPAFRRGDFDAGVLAGASALAGAAREETYSGPVRATAGQARSGQQSSGTPWGTIVGVFFALAAAGGAAALALSGRIPRRCPNGHGRMRRLSESADNAHLDTGQQVEEKIGSVDYDVWACARCEAVRIVPHRKWFSGYEDCPTCTRRAVKRTSRQLVAPTYSSHGEREVWLSCKNCGYSRQSKETLPMLVRSTGGSGVSSGGGGRGGFSGGSSFGGGSAGGGGAGRSY